MMTMMDFPKKKKQSFFHCTCLCQKCLWLWNSICHFDPDSMCYLSQFFKVEIQLMQIEQCSGWRIFNWIWKMILIPVLIWFFEMQMNFAKGREFSCCNINLSLYFIISSRFLLRPNVGKFSAGNIIFQRRIIPCLLIQLIRWWFT